MIPFQLSKPIDWIHDIDGCNLQLSLLLNIVQQHHSSWISLIILQKAHHWVDKQRSDINSPKCAYHTYYFTRIAQWEHISISNCCDRNDGKPEWIPISFSPGCVFKKSECISKDENWESYVDEYNKEWLFSHKTSEGKHEVCSTAILKCDSLGSNLSKEWWVDDESNDKINSE